MNGRFSLTVAFLLLLACMVPERVVRAQASAEAVSASAATATSGTASLPARPGRGKVKQMLAVAAKRHSVEPALVQAIVAAESNYDSHAVSRAGAIGLMQVMPATAADYGVSSRAALFDAATNLGVGVRHLRHLLSKYHNDYGRVIMAYNAGEGVVDRTNSRVTYLETLNYTERVIRYYHQLGGKAPTQAALKQVRALRKVRGTGRARRLMKKYLDPSLLSLKVKPTLDLRRLDPGLHSVGPQSRPMFELDTD